ncbi:hypothetical protein ACDL65_06490 [Corynebacterium belfantii]|uniref:hypothetical protein n=1 Tax=Corynebacterium belfantii TaxID=2014537 RepID=UPI001F158AE1|nr:hypothetical protein [Corynebacterium belfantii]
MARLLKVSQSGYYKWPHTQDQQAAGNDEREAYMAEVTTRSGRSSTIPGASTAPHGLLRSLLAATGSL